MVSLKLIYVQSLKHPKIYVQSNPYIINQLCFTQTPKKNIYTPTIKEKNILKNFSQAYYVFIHGVSRSLRNISIINRLNTNKNIQITFLTFGVFFKVCY